MELYVLQFQTVNFPESLVSIGDIHILQFQVLHLAEELRTIDGAVFHHHIITIPDGRTALWCKVAIRDERAIHMPPWILAIKLGVMAFYVLAALDARLAICNRNIFQAYVMRTKRGRSPPNDLFFISSIFSFILS